MILKDIFNKQVNATRFSIELLKGHGEGENGRPTLILKGHHIYTRYDNHGNTMLKNIESMLARCPCNEKNVILMLDKKEQLEKQCKEIDEQMHREIGELNVDYKYGLEIKWLVEHGYQFYEKDEYRFACTEEELYGKKISTEIEEPEP